MTVEYQTLRNNFYSAKEGALNFKSAKDVYEEIGYDYETLIGQDTRFKNTCAVRMNLALFKSGIFVQGGFEIKKGIDEHVKSKKIHKKSANKISFISSGNRGSNDFYLFLIPRIGNKYLLWRRILRHCEYPVEVFIIYFIFLIDLHSRDV